MSRLWLEKYCWARQGWDSVRHAQVRQRRFRCFPRASEQRVFENVYWLRRSEPFADVDAAEEAASRRRRAEQASSSKIHYSYCCCLKHDSCGKRRLTAVRLWRACTTTGTTVQTRHLVRKWASPSRHTNIITMVYLHPSVPHETPHYVITNWTTQIKHEKPTLKTKYWQASLLFITKQRFPSFFRAEFIPALSMQQTAKNQTMT